MARGLLALVAIAAFVAACTPATEPPTDGGGSSEPVVDPTAHPTDDPAAVPIVGGWTPDALPVDLPDGWRLRDCEGDAPLVCVERDGALAGTLSIGPFPLTDELAAATDGPELRAALRRFARHNTDDNQLDRLAGCGNGYTFTAEDVVDLDMAGLPGVRYGFRGVEDGEVTELVLTWATVSAGQLWIVVAEGVEGGCMGDDEFDLFSPADLEQVLPILDRVVASTPLPASQGPNALGSGRPAT